MGEFGLFQIIILLISGLAGGVLAGLLGIGGGLVYVLAFSFFLNPFDLSSTDFVRYIVANSIFAVFFAGLSASIKQIRAGNFYWNWTLTTAIPGLVSGLGMSYFIASTDWYSRDKFSLFFIILLSLLAYRMFKPSKKAKMLNAKESLPPSRFGVTGLLSGLVSSLSGLGGGVIVIPILSGLMRFDIKKASSISLGIMPIYTLGMSIFYILYQKAPVGYFDYTMGYIIFPMVLPMALGVIIGAPFGVRLAERLSPKVIRLIFAFLMLLVIIKMLYGVFA